MFTIGNFIIGILMVAAGVLTLKFNYQVVGFTGRPEWLESKLGQGSTYFAYKIFSVLLIIIGMLYATGLTAPFFGWLFSPLKHVFGG
jgi:hypothetical protein